MAQALSLPKLERDAYEGVARALYGQGSGIITLRQERLLQELRTVLHVPQEHHQSVISKVQAEFDRPAAEIDTALVGDKEITMPALSAYALKPAKVASTATVLPVTKKRKTPAPAPAPAAAEEYGNGGEPEAPEPAPAAYPPIVPGPLPSLATALQQQPPLAPAVPPAPKIFKFDINNGPGPGQGSPVPVSVARSGVPSSYVSYFTYQPQPGK